MINFETVSIDKLANLGGVFILALLLIRMIFSDLKDMNEEIEHLHSKVDSLAKFAGVSQDFLKDILKEIKRKK